MAAITLVMELFKPGDHLIIDADLYGGSIRLFDNVSSKNGIHFSRIDCWKENVESYVNENTKAIYIETPTNPMMNVTDIAALVEIAKRHNLLLIVDNTFLSPYFQNPLELGADIVVHSGTKFLGGHNDTLAGFLVTNREDISEKLRFLIKTTGSGLAPFDSWLILRGIKTLGIRMEQAQKNAFKIAEWLKTKSAVTRVIYPGLPDHPGYEIMKKQARGFGSMLTFQLESKEFAISVLEKVRMIKFAESLGGVETLITYPTTRRMRMCRRRYGNATELQRQPFASLLESRMPRIFLMNLKKYLQKQRKNYMAERNLDFDKVINRKNTRCLKYDFAVKRGKPADVLPLWVADMDFETSSYIEDALVERAKEGIFGYSEVQTPYFEIIANWMKLHHNWEIQEDWLIKPQALFLPWRWQ